MSKPSRAAVLLQTVVGGLRDPIRHVKYPDEERCARCGSRWPCANGAFDELRGELADLEAENARLQNWFDAAVKRAKSLADENARLQARVEEGRVAREGLREWFDQAVKERDGYKTRAEQLEKAIQKWHGGGHVHGGTSVFNSCPACIELLSALAARPEEARKE